MNRPFEEPMTQHERLGFDPQLVIRFQFLAVIAPSILAKVDGAADDELIFGQ